MLRNRIVAALVVALGVLSIALSVSAQQLYSETLLISVTDTSTDQISAVQYTPLWAKGAILILEVTDASGVLATDFDLDAYSPAKGRIVYAQNCPTGSGTITGDGVQICAYVPLGTATHYTVTDEMVVLPAQWVAVIDESNTETASYRLWVQWIH